MPELPRALGDEPCFQVYIFWNQLHFAGLLGQLFYLADREVDSERPRSMLV